MEVNMSLLIFTAIIIPSIIAIIAAFTDDEGGVHTLTLMYLVYIFLFAVLFLKANSRIIYDSGIIKYEIDGTKYVKSKRDSLLVNKLTLQKIKVKNDKNQK